MERLVQNYRNTCLLALFFGVVSTLVYDFWAVQPERYGSRIEVLVYWIALALRIFTYAVLFVSCRLLADKLVEQSQRTLRLAAAWAVLGLSLAALTWLLLAFGDNLYATPSIKRFLPDTQASFAPGWTIAEVALGKTWAAKYTWITAIGLEAIAIVTASVATAYFLSSSANSKTLRRTYLAPIVSFLILIAYALMVRWSFDWDFDFFIGDALVGAMIFNGIFFWNTLVWGGFAAPAVWVGLITVTNLLLLAAWETPTQNEE